MEELAKRVNRVNLDITFCCIQVYNNIHTYVGRFIKVYRMGSGDGMTVHIEFNDAGKITRVDEEMWGSVNGSELTYFIEKIN